MPFNFGVGWVSVFFLVKEFVVAKKLLSLLPWLLLLAVLYATPCLADDKSDAAAAIGKAKTDQSPAYAELDNAHWEWDVTNIWWEDLFFRYEAVKGKMSQEEKNTCASHWISVEGYMGDTEDGLYDAWTAYYKGDSQLLEAEIAYDPDENYAGAKKLAEQASANFGLTLTDGQTLYGFVQAAQGSLEVIQGIVEKHE